MREVSRIKTISANIANIIKEVVAELCQAANYQLDCDMVDAFKEAVGKEGENQQDRHRTAGPGGEDNGSIGEYRDISGPYCQPAGSRKYQLPCPQAKEYCIVGLDGFFVYF